ncbi:MAG: SGNH/GDSL hydrolase family protein [bacterium]
MQTHRCDSLLLIIFCCLAALPGLAVYPNAPITDITLYADVQATNLYRLTNGVYRHDFWAPGPASPAKPHWLAARIHSKHDRITVTLDAPDAGSISSIGDSSFNSYRIEVSDNSTDGRDGTWQPVVTNAANPFVAMGHVIPFAGRSWVKIVFTGANSWPNTGLEELHLYDSSLEADDSWYVIGDSITYYGYSWVGRGGLVGDMPVACYYPGQVHARDARYTPAMYAVGFPGSASSGLWNGGWRDGVFDSFPCARYVCLAFGMNDCWQMAGTNEYMQCVQSMIDRIKQHGQVPILFRTIQPTDSPEHDRRVQQFNQALAALEAKNHLTPGPDYYAAFTNAGGKFSADGVHPNSAGVQAMHACWAQTMLSNVYSGAWVGSLRISNATARVVAKRGGQWQISAQADVACVAGTVTNVMLDARALGAGTVPMNGAGATRSATFTTKKMRVPYGEYIVIAVSADNGDRSSVTLPTPIPEG